MKNKQIMSTYHMIVTALFAAIMCILGPMSLPIGPVPISLTNLVIYFAVMILGTKLGTISYVIYLLLGAFGLPVFSAYSGGIGKLLGPTGGYLIGFIPMAIITGIVLDKWKKALIPTIVGMVGATLVAYVFGTIWFVISMDCTVLYALTVCVFPFLFGDFLKIMIAIIVGREIKKRLAKAGY